MIIAYGRHVRTVHRSFAGGIRPQEDLGPPGRTRCRAMLAVMREIPIGLLRAAAAQAGLVSRRQARGGGLTDDAIRAQLRTGRWRRIHPGVYLVHAVGMCPADAVAVWAAVLYAGVGATVSHWTAAYLWGLGGDPPSLGTATDVCLPVQRRARSRPAVRIHYAHRLPGSRHPSRSPPVTRIDDTVLDLVDRAVRFEEMITWVTRACQRRRTTASRLLAASAARKKIRWRRELVSVLTDVGAGAESPLELAYQRRVERAHALPAGHRQVHRHAGDTSLWSDVDYPCYGTRVELDGRLGHEGDGAFRDRHRDNLSTVEGWRTLRYGWADATTGCCGTAAEVASVLRAGGWPGEPRRCGPTCRLPWPVSAASVHAHPRPVSGSARSSLPNR